MRTGTILFAHSAGAQGTKGEGSYDLVNYLKEELQPDFEILYPIIADPESPTYQNWCTTLNEALKQVNYPVTLIGHSLGGAILLKYLAEQQPELSVSALFLIATPHWGAPEWDVDEYKLPADFAERIPQIPAIYIYHSVADPVVPFQHHLFYKDALPHSIVRKLSGTDHQFLTGLTELVDDLQAL